MSEQPVRLGMFGCGGRAGVHAAEAAQDPGVEIAWWLDVDAGRARRLAEKYGGRVAENREQVLNDETVQGVVVALPHSLHHEYGTLALQAGKHLMMEIPLAATVAQGLQLIGQARAKNLNILVLHSLRFWRSHQKIAELLHSGILGQPFYARYHAAHYVPPDYFGRQGGQFAAEAGVLHHGDAMQWWLGRVQAVTARGAMFEESSRLHQALDGIVVIYEIEGNRIGESATNWLTRLHPLNQLNMATVLCEGGAITLMQNDELRVYFENGGPGGSEKFQMWHAVDRPQPRGEILHFARCIGCEEAPLITPEEALRALQMTLAAKQSAATGERVVLEDLQP